MAANQPRLSFLASIGPTRRRAERVAAARVDQLDRLTDEDLLGHYEAQRLELLTDDRGRQYEAQITTRRDGSGLELTVNVADLPRRRTLVGVGFRRHQGETTSRIALLYFSD